MSLSLLGKVLFYIWTASEVFIAVATRTRRGGGNVKDRGSMLMLWVVIILSIEAGEWIGRAAAVASPGGIYWLRIASLTLLFTGLVVRWTAILSLGKAFSANVAIRPSQTVYQSGLYRLVRHPSYSGLWLVFLAIALHEQNWIAAAVVLVPTTAALLYRIHIEEAALNEAFGAQYAAYSKRTKRLIPGIY